MNSRGGGGGGGWGGEIGGWGGGVGGFGKKGGGGGVGEKEGGRFGTGDYVRSAGRVVAMIHSVWSLVSVESIELYCILSHCCG